ncbi:MAG: hypothetical protein KGS72_28455 [Cyanobacteria bacterium REEB67]|nr:hypothetical protein [Cyanobacteria bacterium REEB67]
MSFADLQCRVFAVVVPLCAALACSLPALAQTLSAEKQQEVDALTKQIAANENDYSLYAKRGFIYLHANKRAESEIDFDKALSLNPKWRKGYIFRAEYSEDSGKFEAALADYEAAEKLRPLDASEFLERGGIKCKLKRYAEGICDLDKGIALKSDDSDAYVCRAMANWILHGAGALVLSDLEKGLALSPSNLRIRNLLAKAKRESALQSQHN